MLFLYTEEQVHQHIAKVGLEAIIDSAKLEASISTSSVPSMDLDGIEFELWRVIRQKAVEKISRLHSLVGGGTLIGSKTKLPIDKTRPE